MKIESLHIKNYRVFRDVEVKDIPNMAVFLGKNGSGKTTFFECQIGCLRFFYGSALLLFCRFLHATLFPATTQGEKNGDLVFDQFGCGGCIGAFVSGQCPLRVQS